MKRFPWKALGIGCAVLVMLVIGRCAVTAGRVMYYGGSEWISTVLADPWFFAGMAAAAVCVVCFVMLALQCRKEN